MILNDKFKLFFLPILNSLVILVFFIFASDGHEVDLLISLLLSWIFILIWYLGFRLPYLLLNLINTYVLMAMLLGTCGGLYSLIPIYDLLLHGFFGFIGGIITMYVICNNHVKMNSFVFILLCTFTTLGMAAIWEIYEFTIDIIFNKNTQLVQTGVTDTMTDIIITFVGVIIFDFCYLVVKNKEDNWFMRLGIRFSNWKTLNKIR